MDMVLQLAYFFATEDYEDGTSSSTLLIYFTGVLGISMDGATFERALNYTPKLSAIALYSFGPIRIDPATFCIQSYRLGSKTPA